MNIISTKPELFQKSISSIWTDPYIQEKLLAAHLDLSSDAASRNETSINIIVDFIDKQIKNKSQLLDLGCGPGLYAQRFAKREHTITGVDFNKKAIEYARTQNGHIKYIETNYIQDFPHGKYDTILMIYCDIGTHSDTDRNVLLQNCYQSLEDGGKLIFDVFNENIVKDKKQINSWEYEPNGGFWAEEEYLILNQTYHYPENHTFAHQYNLIQDDKVNHFIIWEKYYTEDEIISILKKVGFRNITMTSDLLTGNDFTSSHEIFIVAEK